MVIAMNDKLRKTVICVSVAFSILGYLSLYSVQPTIREKVTFEEFIEQYNKLAIDSGYQTISVETPRVDSYFQGYYHLYDFQYAKMKVYTQYYDNKEYVHSVEVPAKYDKRMTNEEKNSTFLQQMQVFNLSSESIISKLKDCFSKMKESIIPVYGLDKFEDFINNMEFEISQYQNKQFEDYSDWNGYEVTIVMMNNGLIHASKDKLPSSELVMTFEEFKNKYNANVQKDSYALGDFLMRDENIQYNYGSVICTFPYVVMVIALDKNNLGYIDNIQCYSKVSRNGDTLLALATVYSLAATVFDSHWDYKTYRQDKMKMLLFGNGSFSDNNIKYYKMEQGNDIMLVIQLVD